ncbi:uncharacterized protein LOC133866956 [Alnus glutinosa]|uniref:uncharacterized protein LOC133866956 n=1 Tax=Alnus glutinosa TaxID=3517 RepID=UPI002D791A16|nr:uncharacterized protein LOC133866956 [Alnus glutinosa]
MAVDDSFKKPGAVPFKWEIKPGVPKLQQHPHHQKQQQQQPPCNYHRTVLPTPPQKLRPPPSGSYFVPPLEPRKRSFRASPRTRSERWRFDRPTTLVGPEVVSPGCFFSSFLGRKPEKRRLRKIGPASEPDYTSDLETLSRWSVSSRKSLSPFQDSPSSSFSSSYQSSPRPVSDADWAGFGLF